jgi:hypothetical protein
MFDSTEIRFDPDESDAVRVMLTKEREYTHGWRSFVEGKRKPDTEWAARGWLEAEYAYEKLWRDIGWSRIANRGGE